MAIQSKLTVILSLLCFCVGLKMNMGLFFFYHPHLIDYRINSTLCVFLLVTENSQFSFLHLFGLYSKI